MRKRNIFVIAASLPLVAALILINWNVPRLGSSAPPSLLTEMPVGKAAYWTTTSPSEAGFDELKLQSVVATCDELHNFLALLVVRDGKIVVERYFNRMEPERLFQLRSITKNFTSALTGICIEEGSLAGVEQPIAPYFSGFMGENKNDIQVKHLLNMSLGLDWDEGKEVLPMTRNSIKQPIKYLFAKDKISEPGKTMKYNSIASHVLARLLELETQKTLEVIAKEKLFKPLEIEGYRWEKDPEGHAWGGYGLQLTARDLAKFGQMYLQKGQWNGKQVIPEAWVEQSSKKQIEIGVEGGGYSNQWWYADIQEYDAPMYYGQGYGGQALAIVPDKNMVVVAFQYHNVPSSEHQRQWNAFIEKVFRPIYRAAR